MSSEYITGRENHCERRINKLVNNEDLHKVNENQHKSVILVHYV